MREIKFRGYDGMEWIYGSAIQYEEESDTWYLMENGISDEWKMVSSVGQYTGFKDKDGIEIYEHDFVKYIERNLNNAFGGHGEVWETKVKFVRWFRRGWIIPMGFVKELEVIGNIYDNPELSRCENE